MDRLEVYVLCESRSRACAEPFLNAFLPQRSPAAEDYPFPQYTDQPEVVYQTPDEVMQRMETEPDARYSLYWRNQTAEEPEMAMLFYTRDGAMIAGLVVSEPAVGPTLQAMSRQVQGRFGYITLESSPPETRDEFISLCRDSTEINLFAGDLRPAESESAE
jgi:hypothetical protein